MTAPTRPRQAPPLPDGLPRRKDECMECARLPWSRPVIVLDGRDVTPPIRPRKPRPLSSKSGPRTPRCTLHQRAHDNAVRKRESDKRSRARSGLPDELREALAAEQGGRCPCGAALVPKSGRRLNPDADHDHVLAAGHDHDVKVACEDCMRGYLCRHCNREIIGYLSMAGRVGAGKARPEPRPSAEVAQALRRLADYLDHPPMARVRANLRRRAS